MEFLQFAMSGNAKRFCENLKEIGKKNGKIPFLMFVDEFFSMLLFGSGYTDYLNYRFYDRSLKERSEYVTIRYSSKFYNKYCPRELATNLRIKTNFHKHYSEYTKRDYYEYELGIDKLKEFLNKHNVFMIKPIDGLAGRDVKKMSTSEINSVDEFNDYLKNNRMFIEEYVIQDENWGKICNASVNTIRAMTRIINGKAEFFYAVARIGNGTANVDNFHQGGFAVKIDMDKGVLVGNGRAKSLEEVQCHKLSGIKFDGYKIPYWQEIREMVCSAAMKSPDVRVVGWDVAILIKVHF